MNYHSKSQFGVILVYIGICCSLFPSVKKADLIDIQPWLIQFLIMVVPMWFIGEASHISNTCPLEWFLCPHYYMTPPGPEADWVVFRTVSWTSEMTYSHIESVGGIPKKTEKKTADSLIVCRIFFYFEDAHELHVWIIYLHLALVYDKCG